MTTNKEKSIEHLKNYMDQCKAKYHESFKTNSCATILKAYNEWKYASKLYHSAIGVKCTDENLFEKLASNADSD